MNKIKNTTPPHYQGYLTPCIFGIIALVVGVFLLSSYYSAIRETDFPQSLLFKVGLIQSELFITLIFSLIAGLGLIILPKGLLNRSVSILMMIFRIGLTTIFFLIYWKPGWYYILDPAGSFTLIYFVLILEGLQAFSFLLGFKQAKHPTS